VSNGPTEQECANDQQDKISKPDTVGWESPTLGPIDTVLHDWIVYGKDGQKADSETGPKVRRFEPDSHPGSDEDEN